MENIIKFDNYIKFGSASVTTDSNGVAMVNIDTAKYILNVISQVYNIFVVLYGYEKTSTGYEVRIRAYTQSSTPTIQANTTFYIQFLYI